MTRAPSQPFAATLPLTLALGVVLAGCSDPGGPAPRPPFAFEERASFVGPDACAGCHDRRHSTWLATAHASDPDTDADRDRSRQLDGTATCETCHGPGSNHALWHRAQDAAEEPVALAGSVPAAARLLQPAEDLDARGVLESCGRCHYARDRRFAIEDDPRVGYLDTAISGNHDREGFTADGRLDGLYYHASTQKQSACFLKGGMSCLDCHDLHGGKPFALEWDASSDDPCTQCHAASAFGGREHTFHEPADAVCVDCHMPRLTRGVTGRDHAIVSPEPELTERFGSEAAPNACEPCHRDRSAGWARERKEAWWGPAPRRLVEDVGVVAALRRDPDGVDTRTLVALAARAESRLFFRLTAIRHLADRDGAAAAAARRAALQSAEPEIVQAALRALIVRPDPEAAADLHALLEHPLRTVRIEAGAALARAGWRAPPVGVLDSNDPMMRVFHESQRMPERQAPSAAILTRMALCADAVGRTTELAAAVARMEAGWPLDQWNERMLDTLHRRARSLTDSGAHEEAVRVYATVRAGFGDVLPQLLMIDSADSLAATGQMAAAMGSWRYVIDHSDPGAVIHRIARARLTAAVSAPDAAAARSDLEQIVPALLREPGGGEVLRRVRFSLTVLRGD